MAGKKYPEFNKLLLMIKLTTLLSVLTALQVTASVYSQDTKISINLHNGKFADVIAAIEEESEYKIFYKNDQIDLNWPVEIHAVDQPVSEVLEGALEGKGINYTLLNRIIVLTADNDYMERQQNMVKGTVRDASGNDPLPGVNILEKGTTNGTITDINGNYSLAVSSLQATLVFSYVGYLEQEIPVNGQTQVDVSLSEDVQNLDEIVVIGYGTRRKKDLTSSISSVQSDIIDKLPSASAQFALQGNATGVRIVPVSGDPNAAPQIFVRGIGTFVGSSQPLYVIDGQIITTPHDANEDVISGQNRDTPPNLWTLINPSDIESISVLKDAAAAAIYGSRGANGVILITTKRGKSGAPVVEFNSYWGYQNIPHFDILNTQQYKDITYEMFANNLNPDIKIENQLYGRDQDGDTRLISYSPQFDPQSPYYISSNDTYDWQDLLTRKNALDQNYDFKVSGANDKVNYYLSIGYKNQKSNFIGGDLERYSVAVNVDNNITKWLNAGLNYKFALENVGTNDYTDMVGLASGAPWQPIFDPNSPTGYARVLDTQRSNWQMRQIYGQGSRTNYLAIANLNKNDFVLQRHMGHGYVDLKPLKGLSIRGSLNLDYSAQERQELSIYENNIYMENGDDPTIQAPANPDALGGFGSRNNYIFNYQADLTVNYDRQFGDHRITLTGVIQDQYHTRRLKDLSTTNLLTVNNKDKIGWGNDLSNNNSFYGPAVEQYWYGYVARASYNYNSKYYADFSFRRDGSSGFAKDYRWGNFFSVTGAWRISSESFMEGIGFINDLKIRGGYGEAGNDENVAGQYYYLSRVGGSGSYRWGSGSGDPIGNYYPASPVTGFPNPALAWETVGTSYVGFDGVFLDNKVNLTMEYYNKKTSGIQQVVNLPLSVGVDNPAINIGNVRNSGLDILAGYNNAAGSFHYGISANISFEKNEVTKLYQNQPTSTDDYARIEEGRSIGILWGYELGGMFKSQAEIDQFYANTPDQTITNSDFVAPGDLYFKDIGGSPTETQKFYSTVPDSIIDSYDQTVIGNTIPGFIYGINLNADWKGFDVYIGFYGEGKVDKYNDVRAQLIAMDGASNNYITDVLQRYTSSNTNTDMPRAVVGDPAGNNRYSDRFVESAAFFRLNNWQLGYSLPPKVLGYANNVVRSLRVYVGGQYNLYYFNWSGIDPVNDRKPLPRTLNFGFNVKF